MAKIDIVSGFLGAGKTTLIKKLLEEALKGQKVVLIENEFGEIGIDGGFLKDAGINITEMNSGCICCSLVGDFAAALKEVIDRFHPDRIIIEPSGVGKLSDVTRAVMGVRGEADIELNSLVTVADVNKCRMYMKNFGEFYNNQIESARTIILSRTQNADQEKLEACVKLLREKNEDAVIITTPWNDLTGAQLLAAMERPVSLAEELMEEEEICPVCGGHHHSHGHDDHGDHDHHRDHDHHHSHDDGRDDCSCGHDHHDHDHHHEHGHHHDHHADEVFVSWGKETPRKYTREEVEQILKALSETEEFGVILRAKGMLPAADGSWIYFDMVPGEYELREGQPEYTGRLCVIGSKLKEDKLEELFLVK